LSSLRLLAQSNAGASCGVTYAQCHELLSKFGHVQRLVLIGQSPFALAEFASAAESAACHAALDGRDWDRGPGEETRQLFVQYAQPGTSKFFSGNGKPTLQVRSRDLRNCRVRCAR